MHTCGTQRTEHGNFRGNSNYVGQIRKRNSADEPSLLESAAPQPPLPQDSIRSVAHRGSTSFFVGFPERLSCRRAPCAPLSKGGGGAAWAPRMRARSPSCAAANRVSPRSPRGIRTCKELRQVRVFSFVTRQMTVGSSLAKQDASRRTQGQWVTLPFRFW